MHRTSSDLENIKSNELVYPGYDGIWRIGVTTEQY